MNQSKDKIIHSKSIEVKKPTEQQQQQQPEKSKEKKILHRKKHKNSKLGCPQCRQRRVKCDETLPSCKKCASRAIRCGYLDFTSHELEVIRQAHLYSDAESGITNSHANTVSIQYPKDSLAYQVQYQGPITHILHHDHRFRIMNQQSIQRVFPQMDNPNIPPVYVRESKSPSSQHSELYFNINSTGYLNNGIIYKPDDSSHEQDVQQSQFQEANDPGSITSKKLLEDYIHPIYRYSLTYDNSSVNSPSSIDYRTNASSTTSCIDTPEEKKVSPPNYNDQSGTFEFPLVPHRKNKPEYDLKKFPPFFNETVSSRFSRVFLLNDMFHTLQEGMEHINVFKAAIIFGAGKVLVSHSEIKKVFLGMRGDAINYLRGALSNITDDNATPVLRITSLLNKSSLYFEKISLKEFFSFASGPCAVLRAVYENPSTFPNSLPLLKIFASGLLFTSKYLRLPQYDPRLLLEFQEVLKEFGKDFIEDEQAVNRNDLVYKQYISLLEVVNFSLEITRSEKSTQFVSTYPVDLLFELMKRWLAHVPSDVYSFGPSASPIQRVFYVFWHTLMEILEVVLVGTRYIFSFFLNGSCSMHTFDRESLAQGLGDKLEWYLNYNCRIISFLLRRKAWILRHSVLNDSIPHFAKITDHSNARTIEAQERSITNFRTTVIKKIHYPSEAGSAANLNQEIKHDNETPEPLDSDDLLPDMDALKFPQNTVEDVILKYKLNPMTSLLEVDYDPRFDDPLYNEPLNFQNADLDFIDRYIRDRKIIIQNADSYSRIQ